MRSVLVSLILIATLPCGAVSFHAPQSTQGKNEFKKAQTDLAKIAKINDKLKKGNIGPAQIDTYKQQRQALYNDTIRAVIAAYGIRPEHKTGILVSGGELKGKETTWTPAFGEMEPREFKDYMGREQYVPPLPKASAMTWADGKIVIGKDFFNSPALLAAGIIHETVHFEQFTTTGQGICKPYDVTCELEAYKIELSAIKELGLTPAEVHKIGTGMQDQMKQIRGNHWLRVFSVLDPPDPNIESIKNGAADSFLASWKNEAGPLDQEIRKRIAKDQEEREAEKKRADEQKRNHPPEWEALGQWVASACDYVHPPAGPGLINSDPPSDDADRDYLLTHFVVMDKAEILYLESQNKSELDPCQIDMLNLLLKADGPVDVAWLVKKFDYIRSGGEPGVVMRGIEKGLFGIIIGVPEAIVKGISAPFVAIGKALSSLPSQSEGSGGDASGGGARSRSGNGDGSNFHYNDGEAAGQLRGVASGSMSFDGD